VTTTDTTTDTDTERIELDCTFCRLQAKALLEPIASSEHCLAFYDAYPSAPGHVLVIPRRHLGRFTELSPTERHELFDLADHVLAELGHAAGPDAFTIGMNDGAAAGQTVPHLHLHLIPRHHGDRENPRGGIRWVLPATAPYWQDPS